MLLETICTHIVDCEHKTAPVTPGGGFYAVGTPAMRGNVIDYGQAREISADTYGAWTRRLTPALGDLLLAREAPVGSVVLIPPSVDVAPGQRTVLLRPDSHVVNSRFLYYSIAAPSTQRRLADLSMGSTVHHLNVVDVRSLDLHLPDLREQQAIAEVLGALDDKIAANGSLAITCETLMRTLTEGMEFGAQLSALVWLTRNQLSVDAMAKKAVNHYSLPAFDEGQLALQEPGSQIRSNKFSLMGPSVLLSKLNPRFPRVWNVPRPERDAVASTEFLVLEPVNLPTAAVWAVLSTPRTTAFLTEHAAGTSGSHQRVRPADALQLPVPSSEQFSDRMLERLTALGDRALLAREESRSLAQLRDTLLPALMDGRLRVRDAIEQVEEVL